MSRIRKIVVDESVSTAEVERAEKAARERGMAPRERLFLADEHPGIPDGHILHRILDRTTLLVTNDRPLHNEVLRRGLKSFHFDGEQITDRALAGIHRKKQYYDAPLKTEVAASYRPPETPIRAALVPEAARQLKKLRVKRRRIRNHFGGIDNLSEVAITASWTICPPAGGRTTHGASTLIGLVVRVSANVAVKAINASESYIAEPRADWPGGLACLCHALILPIRLNLHPVTTTVYFDAARIDPEVETRPAGSRDACTSRRDACTTTTEDQSTFYNQLAAAFTDLRFVPTPKGERIERLRRKLRVLAGKRRANEIVQGDLGGFLERARNL